jgi:hypothetical protein
MFDRNVNLSFMGTPIPMYPWVTYLMKRETDCSLFNLKKRHHFYCSNIAQIVSKSYQHFNQGRNKSNCWVVCVFVKQRNRNKQRERIQDVVEVVSSNTFASIQQVSEDNLKEFLVSILHLCIQNQTIVNVLFISQHIWMRVILTTK